VNYLLLLLFVFYIKFMFINEYTPLSFYKVVDEMKLGNGV